MKVKKRPGAKICTRLISVAIALFMLVGAVPFEIVAADDLKTSAASTESAGKVEDKESLISTAPKESEQETSREESEAELTEEATEGSTVEDRASPVTEIEPAAIPAPSLTAVPEKGNDPRVSEVVVCEISDAGAVPVGAPMSFPLNAAYNSTNKNMYAIFSIDVAQFGPEGGLVNFSGSSIGSQISVKGNESKLEGYGFGTEDLKKILSVEGTWDAADWGYEIRTVISNETFDMRDRIVFHRNAAADSAAGGKHLVRFVHMAGSTDTGSTLGFVLPNGTTIPGTSLTLTPSIVNAEELGAKPEDSKLKPGTGTVTGTFEWNNVLNELSVPTNTISVSSQNGSSTHGKIYTKNYTLTDYVRMEYLYFSTNTVGSEFALTYNAAAEDWEYWAEKDGEKTLLLSIGGIPGNGTLPAGYTLDVKPFIDENDSTNVTGFDVTFAKERTESDIEELPNPHIAVTVNTAGDVLRFLGGSLNRQNIIRNTAVFQAESLFGQSAHSIADSRYEVSENVSITKNVFKDRECKVGIKYATEKETVYYKITAENNQREGNYFAIADVLGENEDRIRLTGLVSVVIHHSGSEVEEDGTPGEGIPWDEEIKDILINPTTPPTDKPYIVSLSDGRGSVLRNIELHLKDRIELVASAEVLAVNGESNPKAVNNAYLYEAPINMDDETVKNATEEEFKNLAMAHNQASLGVMNEVSSSSGASLTKSVNVDAMGPKGSVLYEIKLTNTTAKGQYLKCFDVWPSNVTLISMIVSAGDGSDTTSNGQYAIFVDGENPPAYNGVWESLPTKIKYPGSLKASRIEFEGIYVRPAKDGVPGTTTIRLGGDVSLEAGEKITNTAGLYGTDPVSVTTTLVQVDLDKEATRISAEQIIEDDWEPDSSGPQVWKAGDIVRYSVTVKNRGKTRLEGITLTDTMNKHFIGSSLVEGKVGQTSGKVLYQAHTGNAALNQLDSSQWTAVTSDSSGSPYYTWKDSTTAENAGTLTIQNLGLNSGETGTFYFFWKIGEATIDNISLGQTLGVENKVVARLTAKVDDKDKVINLSADKSITLSHEGIQAVKVNKRLVYTAESLVWPVNPSEGSINPYTFQDPVSVFGQEEEALSVVGGKKDSPAVAVYEVDIINKGQAVVDISGFRDVAPKNMKLIGIVDQEPGTGSPSKTPKHGIGEIVKNNSIKAMDVAVPGGTALRASNSFITLTDNVTRGVKIKPVTDQGGRETADIMVQDLDGNLSPYPLPYNRVLSLCLVYQVLDQPDDQNGTEQEGSNEYTNFFAVETGNSVTIFDQTNNSYQVPIQPPRKDGLEQSANNAPDGKQYIWTYAKAGVRMYRPGIEKALTEYDETNHGGWKPYSGAQGVDPGKNPLRWTLTLYNGTNKMDSVRKIDNYTVKDTLPWEFEYVEGSARIEYVTVDAAGKESVNEEKIEPAIKEVEIEDEKGSKQMAQVLSWYGGEGDSKAKKPDDITSMQELKKGAGKVRIVFETKVKSPEIAAYKIYTNKASLAVDPESYPYSGQLESGGTQTGSIVCGSISDDWNETHRILADVSVPLLGGSYTTSFKGITNITEKKAAESGFVLDTDEEIQAVGAKQGVSDARDNKVRAKKGDQLTYTLRMGSFTENNNLTRDVLLIDQLPRIGDVGVLNRSEKRKSAFRMEFAENPNVRVYLKGENLEGVSSGEWGVLLPSTAYIVQYGNTQDGVQAELSEKDWEYYGDTAQGGAAPSDTSVGWHDSLQPGDDCIRVSLTNAEKNKVFGNCSLTVAFDAQVPEDLTLSGEGNIAWNSFGYTYRIYNQDLFNPITSNIRSAPPKVGVSIPTSTLKVKKIVEGEEEDTDAAFTFKLQVKTSDTTTEYSNAGGVAYTLLDPYGGLAEYATTDAKTGEFKLKAGYTAVFMIPAGNQYKVSELPNAGYALEETADIFKEDPANGAAGTVNKDKTYETPAAADGKIYIVRFKNRRANNIVVPQTGGKGIHIYGMLGALLLLAGVGYRFRGKSLTKHKTH